MPREGSIISEDLTKRCRRIEFSEFEKLLRECQDRIYNLCRYMMRDPQEAQDAAQDAFLKAFKSLGDFRPEASLYTWLYRIAVNTCLDYKKKKRSMPVINELGEDRPSAEPSPDKVYESKEISEAIQWAIQKLPKKLRLAIVLREIDGLSYEEIAEILAISIGTVKSRISRAREELRRILLKRL
jgi:RNA polymerase sigma-70 factor (ECF subfamily)